MLFGIALSRLGEKKQRVLEVLDGVLQALFGMVRIVMYLAPLAAFGSTDVIESAATLPNDPPPDR